MEQNRSCAVTWLTVYEHIVADASRFKKSSSMLLVHEQETPEKRNIYENKSSGGKTSCIYIRA